MSKSREAWNNLGWVARTYKQFSVARAENVDSGLRQQVEWLSFISHCKKYFMGFSPGSGMRFCFSAKLFGSYVKDSECDWLGSIIILNSSLSPLIKSDKVYAVWIAVSY
jgi:hypothetical protein